MRQGWVIQQLPSGSWRARVRVPGARRYASKTFAQRSRAQAWAIDEAATLRVGGASSLDLRSCNTQRLGDDFVRRLADLGRSISHIADVKRHLALLSVAVPDLAAPSAPDGLEHWLRSLGAHLSPASRNKALAEVRALCRWGIRRGRLKSDPTIALDRVQVPDYMPTVFSIDECRTLLSQVDNPYHRLFAVMLYTGLRVQEACGLHWEDFDWSGRVIMVRLREGVRVKRQKERLTTLQDELCAMLELPWPASRRRSWRSAPRVDETPLRDRSGPMFAGRGFNPYRGFATFLRQASVPLSERSPHSCRHTYASLMTAAGTPALMLSAYLGHTASSTTAIYTKFALRYSATAQSWSRGVLQIMQGVASALPTRPNASAKAS